MREETGKSQEAFADDCNLDRTYVSKIERGKQSPTLGSIEILALALKIPMWELLRKLEEFR